MFFIFMSIDLVFCILAGFSFYKHNMLEGIIYLVVAILLFIFIYFKYYDKGAKACDGNCSGFDVVHFIDCRDCKKMGDCDCNGPDCSP